MIIHIRVNFVLYKMRRSESSPILQRWFGLVQQIIHMKDRLFIILPIVRKCMALVIKMMNSFLNNVKVKSAHIGHDTWIGHGAIIQPGVTVGDGAIVGSGAIVTKDVPPYAIVVGVPAKVIKYRFSEETIAALQRISWWDWSYETIKERMDDFHVDIAEIH